MPLHLERIDWMPSPPLAPDDGPIDFEHLKRMTLGDAGLEQEVVAMIAPTCSPSSARRSRWRGWRSRRPSAAHERDTTGSLPNPAQIAPSGFRPRRWRCADRPVIGLPGTSIRIPAARAIMAKIHYVDEAWREKVGAPTPMEEDMLDFGFDVRPNSRLSCQIKVSDELDGLVVSTPERQA